MKKTLLLSLIFITFLPQVSLGGCPTDINADGVVDVNDFLIILNQFNKHCSEKTFNCPADITDDGIVDTNDFLLFLNAFGKKCATLSHTLAAVPSTTPAAVSTINGFGSIPALNTSLPIGTTPGSFNVSETGNASYTILLVVPPGTAGMSPNLGRPR